MEFHCSGMVVLPPGGPFWEEASRSASSQTSYGSSVVDGMRGAGTPRYESYDDDGEQGRWEGGGAGRAPEAWTQPPGHSPPPRGSPGAPRGGARGSHPAQRAAGGTPPASPGPSRQEPWSPQSPSLGPSSIRRQQAQDKTQWKASQASLKQKQALLQKPDRFCPELASHLNTDVADARRAEDERRFLRDELMGHILSLKEATAALEAHTAHVRPGPGYIAELTQIMDFGERKITEVKEVQRERFEELLREEALLLRDVEAFAERLEAPSWEAAGPGEGPSPSARPATAPAGPPRVARVAAAGGAAGLPSEVEAFDRFEEERGAWGGWEEDDDKAFGRALARARGDYGRVVEVAMAELPHMTRQQIIAHARWHAEHEDLALKKRIAIQKWRAARENERLAAVARCAAPPSLSEAQGHKAATEAEARAARAEEKVKLAAWRAAKRAGEEAAARAKAEAEAARAAEKKAELDERRRAAKEQLLARQRANEAEAVARAEAAGRAAALAPAGSPGARPRTADPAALKRLHQRDLDIVAKRQAAASAKERELERRAKRQQQLRKGVEVEAKRDPGRLLKATKVAEIRRAAPRDAEGFGGVRSAIMHVGHKAAPSWRAPLMGH